ncbi:MAG: LytTR family DNA-binding domain-containing protein [Rhodothermales bacterium]
MKTEPKHNDEYNPYWFAAGIGVFVAAFLLVFRPFGLIWQGWLDPVFWLILGLAPFNAALVLTLDVLFERLAKHLPLLNNPSVGLLTTVCIVVAGNVFYQIALQDEFQWASILTVTWRVFLIALFPTLFVLLFYHRRRTTKTEENPDPIFRFQDENDRESFSVAANDLLFISADRNYILIHTRLEEKPHLLRSSLKTIEAQLVGSTVIRCHRSYMVNLRQVVHRRRLSRSLQLSLKNSTSIVPVSASYIEEVERRLG